VLLMTQPVWRDNFQILYPADGLETAIRGTRYQKMKISAQRQDARDQEIGENNGDQ
jgi:hypothetical protein